MLNQLNQLVAGWGWDLKVSALIAFSKAKNVSYFPNTNEMKLLFKIIQLENSHAYIVVLLIKWQHGCSWGDISKTEESLKLEKEIFAFETNNTKQKDKENSIGPHEMMENFVC